MKPCVICGNPVPPYHRTLCRDEACQKAREKEVARRHYEQHRARYHAAAAASRAKAMQAREGAERIRKQKRQAARRHRWNTSTALGRMVAAEVLSRVIGQDGSRRV